MLRILFLFAEAAKQTKINRGQSSLEKSKNAGILFCPLYIPPGQQERVSCPITEVLKTFIYSQSGLKPKQRQRS
jgi:hypothetical protein